MKHLTAILCLSACAAFAGVVHNVPADGPLASVLAAANAGDEVVVAAGDYTVSATLWVTNGVTLRGATDDFRDVKISGNKAVSRIVRVGGAGSTLSGVTIRDLVASAYCGSGIFAESGACVTNCRVTTGSATSANKDNTLSGLNRYIGGYGVFNSNATLADVTVDGLSASTWVHGAVYQQGANARADRLVITNNTSSCGWNYGSGYLSCVGLVITAGEIRNAFIAGNTLTTAPNRKYANGIFVHMSGGRLVNAAILDNTSLAAGANDAPYEYSVPVYTSGGAAIVNTLVAGNMMGTVERNFKSSGGAAANFSYCCTTPTDNLPDAGNVALNASGYTRIAGGLYTINAASTCVDTGTDEEWMAGSIDLAGNARVQGEHVDIGAVELQRAAFDCSFSAPVLTALDHLGTTLAASVFGDTAGLVYRWDLDGDGAFETIGADKGSVPLSLSTLGVTTVTLQVENGAGATASFSQNFTVRPSRIHYDSHGLAPAEPYVTPATAATSLADAFAIALPGAEVIVAEGTHDVSTTIEPPIGVIVRGATGNRDDVTFAGAGAARLFKLAGAGTTLADVTLSNIPSSTALDGNGVFAEEGSCVTNCRFTASTFTTTPSGFKSLNGYAAYSHNARFVDCLFDGISATQNAYGLALYQSGASALADRCVLTNLTTTYWANGTSYPSCLGIVANGGEVRNSLLCGNRISVESGSAKVYDLGAMIQAANATVANCTVVANQFSSERSGNYTNHTFAVFTSGTGSLVNCLVADNVLSGKTRNWKSTGANLSYCCTTDAARLPGEGNVEAAGVVWKMRRQEGRLALPAGSPCRNAGTTLAWMDGAVDLYGGRRILGRQPDIGAVEEATGGRLVISVQ